MSKQKRILITGCSGFLASYIVKEFDKNETDIFGITEIEDFKSQYLNVLNVDIRDGDKIDKIFREIKPQIVFHFAAVSNVGFSWKNPSLTYEVNFIGSSNLFESIRKYSPESKILLMSSAEVYKVEDMEKIDEQSSIEIKNPYALSKFAMEMLGKLYTRSYGVETLAVRSFNFTGPGQDRAFVVSDFSYQIAAIELGLRPPVIRVGNLSAKRDFSDVRDISRYLRVISEEGKSGEIYNLCSGRSYSIGELLDKLLEMSKVKIRVELDRGKLRISDTPVLACDNTFLKKRFSLEPEFSIDQTLRDSLDFWRNKLSGSLGN